MPSNETRSFSPEPFNVRNPESPLWAITDFGKPVFQGVNFESDVEALTPFFPDVQLRFEELRRRNKDLSVYRPQSLLYAEYKTEPLSFKSLFTLDPQSVNLGELLARRYRYRLYSRGMSVVEHGKFSFSGEDAEPDIKTATCISKGKGRLRYAGEGVEPFIAYTLIANDKYAPHISNIDDLKSLFESLNTDERFENFSDWLQRGMFRLVSKKILAQIPPKILPRGKREALFRSAAEWMKMLNQEQAQKVNVVANFFPIPKEYDREDAPHPDFLPFAADALLEYVSSLPFIIPPGAIYRPETLVAEAKSFLEFCRKVIESGATAKQKTRSGEKLRQFYDDYINLLRFYQANPGLLNKFVPSNIDLQASLPTINEAHDRIREAGGKVGKLGYRYGFKRIEFGDK